MQFLLEKLSLTQALCRCILEGRSGGDTERSSRQTRPESRSPPHSCTAPEVTLGTFSPSHCVWGCQDGTHLEMPSLQGTQEGLRLYWSLTRWKRGATFLCMQMWDAMPGQGWVGPRTLKPAPLGHRDLLGPRTPSSEPVPRYHTAILGGAHQTLGLLKADPVKLPTLVFPNHSVYKDPSFPQTPKASGVPATHVPRTKHILPHPMVYFFAGLSRLPTRLRGS